MPESRTPPPIQIPAPDSDAFKALKAEIDAVIAQQLNVSETNPSRDTLFVFHHAPRYVHPSGRERVRCLWASVANYPIFPIEHTLYYFTEAEIAEIKAHGVWNVIEREESVLPDEMMWDLAE